MMIKVKRHQHRWVAGGYDRNRTLLKLDSMVVSWWIVAFLHSVSYCDAICCYRGDILPLAAIERLHKRPRHDKESRLATVQKGREDRPKYGGKKDFRQNPHASTTDKEKQKGKNFMMVKHKINKKKQGRSFRDKQVRIG